ncbi:polyprenyl synthetase family protein [Desulfobacter hydrogenophilus]|uniref:Polyprenyl synthetase family protein n=1 Tax=Desulfobacter hydrogenophilus TaxID=2291 RepID=A0A328FCT8_9BACT|nr:polyprenyl synthetase family protein [Desulfobacter hydrogenophilus]NDY71927.1 polyprenyl synthetase family protein [Desulfobacter hydrogenophilus]QBH12381.1 polyprenyl synthetase family protein [Desulfobacter hydrogenophilus]RAM02016.1 polyprenyl synthetase family protein [Desulfobacter hydrogenophilus]
MTKDIKKEIMALAGPDLSLVEQALEVNLTPNLDLVRQVAGHLLFAGGKRLRPLLMIHAARMCGFQTGQEIDFSTIFEYLHAATLLHDDVVDGSDTRRGKPCAHTLWDAPTVVLTGDFLLATALVIAAKTKSARVIEVIAQITADMSQGEILQMKKKGNPDLTENEYNDIIERKTAVLIQGACRTGAIVAKADQNRETALKNYGWHLGMAFQMADDLLDYTATADQLGKNPGADMREGKLTLPLIYSLGKADAQERKWMLAAMSRPQFNPEEFKDLKERLTRLGGTEYTNNRALAHVQSARTALDIFPESPSKHLLELIADYSILRKV